MNKKLQIKGERLYDAFLERAFNTSRFQIKIQTPRTQTLELFALLEKKDKYRLVGAMCVEAANNLQNENIYVKNGKLFEKITIDEVYG